MQYTEDNLWGDKTEGEGDRTSQKSEKAEEDNDQLVGDQESEEEGSNGGGGYQEMENLDSEEEDEDEDGEFDHLVPENWQQLADMRLRMLEKEYNQCLSMEKGVTQEYQFQGLGKVLGIEERLKQVALDDLKQAQARGEKQRQLEEEDGFDDF